MFSISDDDSPLNTSQSQHSDWDKNNKGRSLDKGHLPHRIQDDILASEIVSPGRNSGKTTPRARGHSRHTTPKAESRQSKTLHSSEPKSIATIENQTSQVKMNRRKNLKSNPNSDHNENNKSHSSTQDSTDDINTTTFKRQKSGKRLRRLSTSDPESDDWGQINRKRIKRVLSPPKQTSSRSKGQITNLIKCDSAMDKSANASICGGPSHCNKSICFSCISG